MAAFSLRIGCFSAASCLFLPEWAKLSKTQRAVWKQLSKSVLLPKLLNRKIPMKCLLNVVKNTMLKEYSLLGILS